MITLNNIRVPGTGMLVRAQFKLAAEDLGGQSSASDQAETGISPQTLSVSLTIPLVEHDDMNTLIQLARATEENGQRRIYDIVNCTAAAGNIRQVRFSDNFSYAEDGSLRIWRVSFSLREYLSVPEKVEHRQKQPAEGSSTNNPDADGSGQHQQQQEIYSGFRAVLHALDDALE